MLTKKDLAKRPPCDKCGYKKVYSQGRNWVCQECGRTFPKEVRTPNYTTKDLGERPPCDECGSIDIGSRGTEWRCKSCGHSFPKQQRIKPMKDVYINLLAAAELKKPTGLLTPPREIVCDVTDKTLVAMFDQHLDPLNRPHPSFELAMQCTYDIQPDIIILGGDWLEFASMSIWEQNKSLLMEGRRYKLEIEMGKHHLLELRRHCPDAKIYFFEGNHEYRVRRYVEQDAKVAGLIDVRTDLNVDGLNMEWVPFNKIIRIGKLCFLHGEKWNKFFAQATLNIIGQSCMFGHAHRYQVWTQRLRFDQEPNIAIGVPALTAQNPTWKRGQHTDWMNGFAVVEYREGGFFNAHVLPIVGNSFSYNGKSWKLK